MRVLAADQLQPIPEWIVHMAAAHPRDIVRLGHFNSRISQPSKKRRVITAAQRWMRLLRRTKITLDSKMELHTAALKPASTALGKLRRLRYFRHSKQAFVKRARLSFLTQWHSELHVIDGNKRCKRR